MNQVTILQSLTDEDYEDLGKGHAPIDDIDFVFFGPGAWEMHSFIDEYWRIMGGREVEQYTIHFRGKEQDVFLHTHA